jgi:hypothetical protein
MIYTAEIISCVSISISSFMTTGIGLGAILKFVSKDLRGGNFGIASGGGYEIWP